MFRLTDVHCKFDCANVLFSYTLTSLNRLIGALSEMADRTRHKGNRMECLDKA